MPWSMCPHVFPFLIDGKGVVTKVSAAKFGGEW